MTNRRVVNQEGNENVSGENTTQRMRLVGRTNRLDESSVQKKIMGWKLRGKKSR